MIVDAIDITFGNIGGVFVGEHGRDALTRIRAEWEDGAMLPTLLFHEGILWEG